MIKNEMLCNVESENFFGYCKMHSAYIDIESGPSFEQKS